MASSSGAWHSAVIVAIFLCGCARKAESGAPALALSAAVAEPNEALKVGSPLPNVAATAHTGERIELAALEGKPVVVYFYPKDDTPGCTVEAEEIRDLWQDIQRANALVVGVSTDDEASHRAFAEKHALPFLLLPDPKHEIATAFHVPLKNGRAKRMTFVFGADGRLKQVFPDVQPKGHAREILAALGK